MKRAIFDTIATYPFLPDDHVAAKAYLQETEEDCFGFWAYCGTVEFDIVHLVPIVQNARRLLAQKEEICLAAFMS